MSRSRETPQGWYHLGHGRRVYSSQLMRFHCPDSLSPFDAGGLNAYAYCLGDPLNFTDPTGRSTADLYGMTYLLNAMTAGLGLLSVFAPVVLRRARPGSWLARYADKKPDAATPIGGLDAAATGIGLASAAVGIVSTSLSIDDPQNEVVSIFMRLALGLSIGVLGVKATAKLTPRAPESATGQKFAQVIHGKKAVRDALREPDPATPVQLQHSPNQTLTFTMRELRTGPVTALNRSPHSSGTVTRAPSSREQLERMIRSRDGGERLI